MDVFDILVETIMDHIKTEEDPEYREGEIKRINALISPKMQKQAKNFAKRFTKRLKNGII